MTTFTGPRHLTVRLGDEPITRPMRPLAPEWVAQKPHFGQSSTTEGVNHVSSP